MKFRDKIYMQFANCMIVKGDKRSVVCDLQRSFFKFIPNELYNILNSSRFINLNDLYNQYANCKENIKIIDQYVTFLIDEEFGCFIEKEEIVLFPEISKEFLRNTQIKSCILIFSEASKYLNGDEIKILEKFGLKHVTFIISEISLDQVVQLVLLFEETKISSIELFFEYGDYETELLSELINNHNRVNCITLYNSPTKGFETTFHKNILRPIRLLDRNITHMFNMERAPLKFDFIINTNFFIESEEYNVYYNNKIFINHMGEVSNVFKGNTYGVIGEIENIIVDDVFKDLWATSKNNILICRDCEFRKMCLDSRIPIRNKKGEYQYTTECNYNPYTAKWKHEVQEKISYEIN